MNTSILVTGGTGYIGSHTVVELQNAGYDVVIIDDLSNSSVEVLDGIAKITGKKPCFEQFNLCDKELLTAFFSKYKNIKAIIHFAAHKSVPESMAFPLKYYQNNIFSTINLLEEMIINDIGLMVFSSSCSVYGEPDSMPVSEDAQLKPAQSPYGNTKKICEDIIIDTCRSSPITAVLLRYFNPIGAHYSSYIGETPTESSDNIIPNIFQVAKGKKPFFKVYGDDYNTPDGSCIRDYIHVTDIALAHVVAVRRLLNEKYEKKYEIFNLGTGTGYSVFQLINTFKNVIGSKIEFKVSPRRYGDVGAVFADTNLANHKLGWKALKSLDEMLSSAWEWEKGI